jgi:hypothetical protein
MRRLALLLALPLGGCFLQVGSGAPVSPGAVAVPVQSIPTGSSGPAITPLGNTAIDDQLIRGAWLSYDFALDWVESKVKAGELVKGTPKALAVKAKVDAALMYLEMASAAQRAGNATSYMQALADVTAALAAARTAGR